jgi:hypothetical protein
MKSLVLVIGAIFLGLTLHAQANVIEKVRFLYFEDWTGECGAEKLVDYFEARDIDDHALLTGYKGAALATTANCKSLPWQKLSIFNRGKGLIESAVQSEPQNLEIRFIRFTIQSNIPGILNYDNMAEDKDFILNKLNLHMSLKLDDKMVMRMYNYLRNSDELSIEEKNKLDILMVKG